MKAYLLVILALLGICSAQLTIQGKYKPSGQVVRVFSLPPQDNDLLRAEEDASHGGYQFANPVDVVLSSSESGFWSIQENGDKVWSLTIKSEGAVSLSVAFKGFYIPEGGELFVMGEKEIRGAYSSINNAVTGHFVTFPLVGSSLTLEYYQPASVKGYPQLDVMKVSHGYRPFNFGDSGACNNNAICDTVKWVNQTRSVGMLLSGFGSRFCSGGLVNNVAQDGTQYFLTAFHCSVDSADSILFNYQSPTCEQNRDGSTSNVIAGLVSLAKNANSDFSFFRVDEPIPASWNVYLAGISGENIAPKSMVGIHHPSGDVKKISYANKAGTPTRWSSAEPGNWHWRVPSWDDGTTEPGSSGSPLFDQNQRVVGQLHGGAASCRVIDYDSYGATWSSWSLGLKQFIDPKNTGALLVNGANLNDVRK